MLLYCIIVQLLYCYIELNNIKHYIVLHYIYYVYNIILYNTILYYRTQYNTILYYTLLYHIILHYILVLNHISLYHIKSNHSQTQPGLSYLTSGSEIPTAAALAAICLGVRDDSSEVHCWE